MPPASDIICLNENGLASIVPPSPRMTVRLFGFFGMLRKSLKTDPNLWLNQQYAEFETELEGLRKTDVARLNNQKLIEFIQHAVAITSRVGAIRFRDFIIPAMARSAF